MTWQFLKIETIIKQHLHISVCNMRVVSVGKSTTATTWASKHGEESVRPNQFSVSNLLNVKQSEKWRREKKTHFEYGTVKCQRNELKYWRPGLNFPKWANIKKNNLIK